MDKEQIENINCRLRSNKASRALTSCVANAVPIPGLGIGADITMLVTEIPYCLKEYQLTDAVIRRYAAELKVSFEELANELNFSKDIVMSQIAIREFAIWFVTDRCKKTATTTIAKFIPVLGNILAGGLAYASMDYLLEHFNKSCSEDAYRLSAAVNRIREERLRQKQKSLFYRFRRSLCCICGQH